MLKHNVRGTFVGRVQAALDANQSLAGDIAQRLLDAHFPHSLHGDILDAVGLPGPIIGPYEPGHAVLRASLGACQS